MSNSPNVDGLAGHSRAAAIEVAAPASFANVESPTSPCGYDHDAQILTASDMTAQAVGAAEKGRDQDETADSNMNVDDLGARLLQVVESPYANCYHPQEERRSIARLLVMDAGFLNHSSYRSDADRSDLSTPHLADQPKIHSAARAGDEVLGQVVCAYDRSRQGFRRDEADCGSGQTETTAEVVSEAISWCSDAESQGKCA